MGSPLQGHLLTLQQDLVVNTSRKSFVSWKRNSMKSIISNARTHVLWIAHWALVPCSISVDFKCNNTIHVKDSYSIFSAIFAYEQNRQYINNLCTCTIPEIYYRAPWGHIVEKISSCVNPCARIDKPFRSETMHTVFLICAHWFGLFDTAGIPMSIVTANANLIHTGIYTEWMTEDLNFCKK